MSRDWGDGSNSIEEKHDDLQQQQNMNHGAKCGGNDRDNAAACVRIASAVSAITDSLHPFCDIMIIVQDRRVVRVEITNKYKIA